MKPNDVKVQLASRAVGRLEYDPNRIRRAPGILPVWMCQQSICIIGCIGAVFIEDLSLAFAWIGINDITPVTDARLRGIGWTVYDGVSGVGVGSITRYPVIRGSCHSGA